MMSSDAAHRAVTVSYREIEMFTRLRIFSAIALIWVSSSAMAVTGTTTFVPGDNSSVGGADVGYSVDSCDGPSMGSMAMPILSDGKKICALYETDLNPFGENTIVLVIEGFTSDPGVNYFKTLSLPCGLSLAPS